MEPFVTEAEFSAWTGGAVSESDPRVKALLAGASDAIRRYCGWHIAPSLDETVILDGPGGDVLTLDSKKVTGVSKVAVLGVDLDPGAFDWSELGNIQLRCGRFPDRYRSVSVDFTHGYALEDVEDVKQIVKQVCAAAISSPMGATREQAGALSVSWATTAPNVSGGLSLLGRDLATLAPFRLYGGA